MLWIYLLARLFYRDSRAPLSAMGIAALVLLVLDPRALFDASFEMTFLAVLAIGGIGMPLLARALSKSALDAGFHRLRPATGPGAGTVAARCG